MDKNTFKLKKIHLKGYIIVSLLLTLALTSFVIANVFAPVQNVSLIATLSPFVVLIFGFFILKEKITSTKIITLVIALTGLIIINPFRVGPFLIGNLLALVNTLFSGMLIVYMRKEDKNHDIGSVFWFMLFATIILLPFPFIYGFGNILAVLPYILILGIIATGIRFILANLALEKIEAEIFSITGIIITPIVSILLAVLIINEALSLRVVIGGVLLVIAGVYLETHNKRIKKINN